MQSVSVLSIAPDAIDWMMNSHRPRILHVFDKACNLINEQKVILSIVTLQIGNGPFSIVIEKGICFSEYLSLESSVSLSHAQIHLGGLAISTANAKLWHPRPNWEMLHAKRDDILNHLVPLSAHKYQVSLPNSLISKLSFALINADTSTARTVTSQLAGLGQGLTPSGDDFLMGAMYATWILHLPEVAGALAKEIVDVAAPMTTSLSAAWLRSAGKGEAGIVWHELFDVLNSVGRIGNPTYTKLIQDAMNNILSIGETSGADALTGFLAVFTAYKERIIDKCLS